MFLKALSITCSTSPSHYSTSAWALVQPDLQIQNVKCYNIPNVLIIWMAWHITKEKSVPGVRWQITVKPEQCDLKLPLVHMQKMPVKSKWLPCLAVVLVSFLWLWWNTLTKHNLEEEEWVSLHTLPGSNPLFRKARTQEIETVVTSHLVKHREKEPTHDACLLAFFTLKQLRVHPMKWYWPHSRCIHTHTHSKSDFESFSLKYFSKVILFSCQINS